MAGLWQEAKSWFHRQLEPPMSFINGGLLIVVMIFVIWCVLVPDQQGMVQNLVAEVFGVWLAVVLIGEILRRDREKRELPTRYVAVHSAYSAFSRAVLLWKSMVQAGYIPARDNGLLEDPTVGLFDQRLVLIVSRLQLDAPRFHGSRQTWRDYLKWQSGETIKGIIESLQISGAHMSPNSFYALHNLRLQGFWHFLQHSNEIEAIRARAKVPKSCQLDFGDPNNPYQFLESMHRLGRVLAEGIPQFNATEDLPLTIDPDCRQEVEEIMARGHQN